MKKVDKSFRDKMQKECGDMICRNNNRNMRTRYVFLLDGKFICLENTCNGWYVEQCVTSFSNSVCWLNDC